MMILALLLCSLDLKLPSGIVRQPEEVQTIVLHHTTLPTMGDSIRVLRLRGLSYHYLIDEQGGVVLITPFLKTAFHAAGANHSSVGIAFTGGMTTEWAPTPEQRAAAKELIARLVRMYPSLRYIIGHGDVRDINAGEPYGVNFDELRAELRVELNIELAHPTYNEEPLARYREMALERLANPRTPPTPGRRARRQLPPYETATCRTGNRVSHVRYKVSFGR